MKYRNAKLRHELKYFISWKEYVLIRSKLATILRLDDNTKNPEGYLIRSLYFDDMYDTGMFEKLVGVQRRDKYRIRIYDYSDKTINFERKSKYDSYISKVSAPLNRTQTNQILSGDYNSLRESENTLLKEIYVKRNTVLLRPAVIVDYLREAYIYQDGNVRITFDKFISAGVGSFNIFSRRVPTYPVVEKDLLVLEIKYDNYLPTLIKGLVKSLTGDTCAISKYVMCRTRLADIKTVSKRVVTSIDGR